MNKRVEQVKDALIMGTIGFSVTFTSLTLISSSIAFGLLCAAPVTAACAYLPFYAAKERINHRA